MTYRELRRRAQEQFEENKIADAENDAAYLVMFAADMSRAQLLLHDGDEAPDDICARVLGLAQRRALHEPLQYITGSQEFMGLDFVCSRDTLIPRGDTEILAEKTLEAVAGADGEPVRVLDMCTGTGCIIISVAKLTKRAVVCDAADVSEAALEIAKGNAGRNGAEVNFIRSDMFEAVSGEYDVIVSNPPYIGTAVIEGLMPEVRDYEPRLALDGGEDGLDFYRILACEGRKHLRSGGMLLLEIGEEQGESVSRLLAENGFDSVRVFKDLAGLDRVVTARRV